MFLKERHWPDSWKMLERRRHLIKLEGEMDLRKWIGISNLKTFCTFLWKLAFILKNKGSILWYLWRISEIILWFGNVNLNTFWRSHQKDVSKSLIIGSFYLAQSELHHKAFLVFSLLYVGYGVNHVPFLDSWQMKNKYKVQL